jgi:predicted dehydrogenase
MQEKLRVGIAGASGWMAGALAVGIEYEEGFDVESGSGRRSSEATVSALCDLDRDQTERRKSELGLDGARCFQSYEEMLASDEVDAVAVVVPNHLHAEFAIQALEAGKHLFLEKPFATTWDDSRRLAEAVRWSPKTTKLDYIMLHYDEQENLRALVERGAFGTLGSIHCTYRHPIQVGQSEGQMWKLSRSRSGGAVPMGICHALSMAVYQVAAAPEWVVCKSSPPKLRAFDYDTQVDMMVAFENGVVGVVQGNIDFAEKYDARHTLIGTEGQFDYNPYNPLESRVTWSSRSLGRPYSPDPGFARHHLDSGDVWKHQCARTIREFVRHARAGRKDPLLGLESDVVRRVESIIWAAEHSAREGSRPVATAEFLT